MSDPNIVEMAAELADLQDKRKRLEEREDEIKEKLRGYGEGRHQAGNLTVEIQPNKRLDPDQVRKLYPPEQNPTLYEYAPKAGRVREIVAPATYKAMMVEVGEAKVILRS